ncbi:MAG TPA: hypothetical protein VMZ26_12620, partial [Pyrinomonadaceae bacterium]|nr:hypothetical protein [Pyrinomonadaceae bacterium]
MNLIRLPHSAVIRFGFGAFVLALSLPFVSAAQELKWELVLPFRFIRDPNAMNELKLAYESIKDAGDNSAEGLERKLQDLHETEVGQRRQRDLARCLAEAKGTPAECDKQTRY